MFTNCDDDDGTVPFEGIANGSFESSEPGISTVPIGWENCGDTLKTPTDLFRNELENSFEVTNLAQAGQQYIGMVVRLDGSRECISQTFENLQTKGSYQLSASIAKPINYESLYLTDSGTSIEVNYNTPVSLELIIVDDNDEETIIHVTEPNETVEWIEISTTIEISEPFKAIKISPNFIGNEFYSGGILIDSFDLTEN